jgi:hypothetical protein
MRQIEIQPKPKTDLIPNTKGKRAIEKEMHSIFLTIITQNTDLIIHLVKDSSPEKVCLRWDPIEQ